MPSTGELIAQIYAGYFNRAPDPAGLAYWVGRANAGMTLTSIAQSFAVQPEAVALYSFLGAPAMAARDMFISSVYSNLFNRAPDAAGAAYWAAQLSNPAVPVSRFISDVLNGAQGNDLLIATNKGSVGAFFITQLNASNMPFSMALARGVLANVNASPGSVVSAVQMINDAVFPPPPPAPTALTLTGTAGADTLTGGSLGETLSGLAGADTLSGNGGDDTLNGGADADTLNGDAGNDIFLFNTGDAAAAEALNGGADTDTVSIVTSTDFSNLATATLLTAGLVEQILITSGQTATFTGAQLTGQALAVNATAAGAATLAINVATGTAANFSTLSFTAFGTNNAFDTGTDVISITGAAGAENITGTGIADTISGAGGTDTLNGGAGNDTLNGGAGKDTITTGTGADTVIYASGPGVTDTVAAAASIAGVDLLNDLVLNAGTADRVDLTVAVANIGTTVTGAANEGTFILDLSTLLNVGGGAGFNTDVAGTITAAVVVINGAGLNGRSFLAVDLDGSDTFTATDFVVEITGSTVTALTTATFI